MIDTRRQQEAWQEGWSSQTQCQVNDPAVRLGAGHGRFHWHKHDHEDEFFRVLEGWNRQNPEHWAAEARRF